MCMNDDPNEPKVTSLTKELNNENDKIELDVDALRKVLRNREWINLPIAIISVAGPFRTGKSFLLNSLCHIMKNREKNEEDVKLETVPNVFESKPGTSRQTTGINILSEPFIVKSPENSKEEKNKEDIQRETIPNVFESKSGTARQTTGINILSKPFIVKSPENSEEEIAVFLMDSQGIFDNKTSKQNEIILGMLSFLLSSMQLFNVKENIGSNYLEHIYEFAKKAQAIKKKNENCEPIQAGSLMFVVRDFENEDEYDLGLEGGEKFIQKLLENPDVAQNQVMLQKYMKSTYGTIPCCLLPHPSKNVRKSPSFSDLDKNFSEHIFNLFDFVLSEKEINLKKIRGNVVTCSELATILETHYIYDGFEGRVDSVIEADTEALMRNLIAEIVENFLKEATKRVKSFKDDKRDQWWLPSLTMMQSDEKQIKNILKKLRNNHEKKLKEKMPNWIQNADTWINKLKTLLDQVEVAVEACCNAEEKYLNALQEFQSFLEKTRQECGINDISANEENLILQEKLFESLRKDIDSSIVDQCCEHFNNHINKILADEIDEVKKFFEKLEEKKVINTLFDIGRIVAGGLGIIAGAAITLTGVGAVVGVPFVDKSVEYMKSGIQGENRKGRMIKKGNFFTLPDEEFHLKKYENTKIHFSLCFGEITYPLKL